VDRPILDICHGRHVCRLTSVRTLHCLVIVADAARGVQRDLGRANGWEWSRRGNLGWLALGVLGWRGRPLGSDALGSAGEHLRVQRSGFLAFPALSWHLGVLVLVLRFTRRATCLLHVVANHRDDGVIGQPPLARTVVIENVTKPKLALLHQKLPKGLAGRERDTERRAQS